MFFQTTSGIQSVSDAYDESRFVMKFVTNLGITGILVIEWERGKEIPE